VSINLLIIFGEVEKYRWYGTKEFFCLFLNVVLTSGYEVCLQKSLPSTGSAFLYVMITNVVRISRFLRWNITKERNNVQFEKLSPY
jgi:hypothetical protein